MYDAIINWYRAAKPSFRNLVPWRTSAHASAYAPQAERAPPGTGARRPRHQDSPRQRSQTPDDAFNRRLGPSTERYAAGAAGVREARSPAQLQVALVAAAGPPGAADTCSLLVSALAQLAEIEARRGRSGSAAAAAARGGHRADGGGGAHGGVPDDVQALCEAITGQLRQQSAAELARLGPSRMCQLAHALGVLRWYDEGLLAALQPPIFRNAQRLSLPDLAHAFWGLSALRQELSPAQLQQLLARVATASRDQSPSTRHLLMLLQGLRHYRPAVVPPETAQRLQQAVAAAESKMLPTQRVEALHACSVVMSGSPVQQQAIAQSLAPAALQQAGQYRAAQLAQLCTALAAAGVKPSDAQAETLFAAVRGQLRFFRHDGLPETMAALAALRLRPPRALCDEVVIRLHALLPQMSASSLTQSIVACAASGTKPYREWFLPFFERCRIEADAFSRQQLVEVFVSLSHLQVAPNFETLYCFVATIERQLPAFDRAQLAALAGALGVVYGKQGLPGKRARELLAELRRRSDYAVSSS